MAGYDATTQPLRRPAAGTVDVWDDLLRLARRVEYETTQSLARRWTPWLVPAALTLLVGAVGLARPGMWTDELATWGMTTVDDRSQFWWVLRYVDAVIAPYYVFMHGWAGIFGDSDVSLRTPSLLAMAISAGLIGALGGRLSGRRAGLLAGIVFALLPSTSRFAAEARPYALTVLAAVAATYLLVLACDRPTLGRWAAYGLAVVAIGLLNIVAILVLAAHACVVLAWHRRMWWRFALVAVGCAVAMVPVLIYGMRQRNQVSYIPRVSFATFDNYAEVLFGSAILAFLVIGLAAFALPLRYPAAIFTSWAVVPAVALIVVSLVTPMFLPRYLLYTTPGWALLAGVALARLRWVWFLPALLAIAALGLPAQIQMRAVGGHEQATGQLAGIIAAGVQAGDGIVYADDEPVGSWTARDAVAHYVPAERRPSDVLATNPPRHDGLLLATECREVARCLADSNRLWIVRIGHLEDPLAGIGPAKEAVLREQFHLSQAWYPEGLTLALLQRQDSP